MRILLPAALCASLLGCIVYDEKVTIDDLREGSETSDGGDDRPTRPESLPTDEEERLEDSAAPEADAALRLCPSELALGETVILSARVQPDTDHDLEATQEARFFGPSQVQVLATAHRGPHELLLTVHVPIEAKPGRNDVLLQLEGSRALYGTDALSVRVQPDDVLGGPCDVDEPEPVLER